MVGRILNSRSGFALVDSLIGNGLTISVLFLGLIPLAQSAYSLAQANSFRNSAFQMDALIRQTLNKKQSCSSAILGNSIAKNSNVSIGTIHTGLRYSDLIVTKLSVSNVQPISYSLTDVLTTLQLEVQNPISHETLKFDYNKTLVLDATSKSFDCRDKEIDPSQFASLTLMHVCKTQIAATLEDLSNNCNDILSIQKMLSKHDECLKKTNNIEVRVTGKINELQCS